MASVSDLLGIMKFVKREEWRVPFEEIHRAHLFIACRKAGIEVDDIAEHLGEFCARTLWGCAFEDFLARTPPGGRNVVDEYLKRRGFLEKMPAKAYMKAIRRSVMSLHEVSGIVPGESFLARDLIRGGKPVRVSERSATIQMKPWDRIGARIVPLAGTHVMCGGTLVFDLDTSEQLIDMLRRIETDGDKRLPALAAAIGAAVNIKRLKEMAASGELLELTAPVFTYLWLTDALDRALNPRLPELRNTDGDPILFCTLRFPLRPAAALEAVRTALQAVPDLHQEDDTFFNWIEAEAPARPQLPPRRPGQRVVMSTHSNGGTILGSIEITDAAVIFTANSRERAERGTASIGAALDDLAGTPALEIETPEEVRAKQKTQPKEKAVRQELSIPPEEKRRLVHAHLDDHYRKTLNKPNTMLDNMSPRQAVKTAAGRDKVVAWLKYLENSSRRHSDPDDPLATYDAGWIWAELGLTERRV